MKGVLFVSDNIFIRDEKNIYSNSFSYAILKRYIDIFSKVTVVGRVQESSNIENISLASGNGVDFILLDSISNLSSFMGKRGEYKKLFDSIISEYDGVIVRLPSELGLLISSVAREKNISYLVEVVGCGFDAMRYYGGVRSKIYAPILYLKMRYAIQKAPFVCYVTQEFLQKRYPTKGKSISISDVYIPLMNSKVLLDRVDKIKSQTKITIATIAFLDVDYKGIDRAIEAISTLDADCEYHILGDGNPQRYRRLAKDMGISVKFIPSLPQGERVWEWLDNIDIYIQPSLTEGLPRALIEAMSRGCPIIASSVGDIPLLLDRDMLHSPKDTKRLSQLISNMIDHKSLQIEQAQKNFKTAQRYSSDILDREREEFYSSSFFSLL